MVEMLRLATRLKFPSKSISTRPVIVRLGEGSTHSKLLPIRKNRAFTWNSGAASGPVSTRNSGRGSARRIYRDAHHRRDNASADRAIRRGLYDGRSHRLVVIGLSDNALGQQQAGQPPLSFVGCRGLTDHSSFVVGQDPLCLQYTNQYMRRGLAVILLL